jgi:hypothetical protein
MNPLPETLTRQVREQQVLEDLTTHGIPADTARKIAAHDAYAEDWSPTNERAGLSGNKDGKPVTRKPQHKGYEGPEEDYLLFVGDCCIGGSYRGGYYWDEALQEHVTAPHFVSWGPAGYSSLSAPVHATRAEAEQVQVDAFTGDVGQCPTCERDGTLTATGYYVCQRCTRVVNPHLRLIHEPRLES